MKFAEEMDGHALTLSLAMASSTQSQSSSPSLSMCEPGKSDMTTARIFRCKI